MVQIIPGGTDLNLGLIHDFISHMVQIIRLIAATLSGFNSFFISHMVQIIRPVLQKGTPSLIFFISHMVQIILDPTTNEP